MENVHRASDIIGILGELDRSSLLSRDVRNVLELSLPEALARYDIMVTDDAAVKARTPRGRRVFALHRCFPRSIADLRWIMIVKRRLHSRP